MEAPKGWCLAPLLLVATATLAQGPARGPGRPASDDATAVARRVDAMLAEKWASAHVAPVAVADDAEFLRRAYLDAIGTIPTAAETRDFLDDPSPDKRAALIERLLDGPSYTARAAEIWRQVLL